MTPARLVIDANVALYAFAPSGALDENLHFIAEAARHLLLHAVNEDAALFVPWLFFSEVTNTITRNVGSSRLTESEGEIMLESIMSITWTPLLPKWRDVFRITRDLQRNKSGDSEFVAVALDTGARLITTDDRLLKNAESRKLDYPITPVQAHAWSKT
jgi:predicted nucleic acid-binding protein